MNYHCPNCKAKCEIPVAFEWKIFACGTCKSYYQRSNTQQTIEKNGVFDWKSKPALPIGTQGTIEGECWTITGYIERNVAGGSWWAEYHLLNDRNELRYLILRRGYWMWAEEVKGDVDDFLNYNRVSNEWGLFDLFYNEAFITDVGEGFFKENLYIEEEEGRWFINPPLAMLIRKNETEARQFIAKRLEHKEMKDAFPKCELLETIGPDILEPRFSSWWETFSILSVTFVLIYLLYGIQSGWDITLASGSAQPASGVDTTIVTKEFELTNYRQMVTVKEVSNVDNSWLYAGATLVNVTTGEERYTESELNYYHGYDDGYQWSEGSRAATLMFCEVPKGKYVVLLDLQRPSGVYTDVRFNYEVKYGGSSFYAFALASILLIVFGVVVYHVIEHRWSFSRFVKYPEENKED